MTTSDGWVWAPWGIWHHQSTEFPDGSRSMEGSVLLKGIYFLQMLLSLIQALGLPVTVQMPGQRPLLRIPSCGLWAELPVTAIMKHCRAFSSTLILNEVPLRTGTRLPLGTLGNTTVPGTRGMANG